MIRYFSILLILLGFAQLVVSQDYTTITYFKDSKEELKLDLFIPPISGNQKVPLVIFVHGGGFSGGDRTSGHNFCKVLTQNGFAAASMSYTLYMKGKSFSCDGILTEKVKAIQLAVSQLWQATGYLIKHGEKFKIDTTKIFIAGSSAGAETVFHAAYWDRKLMSLYPDPLAEMFHYKGLVAGAGAIMDINLIRKENLIPMLMFHGNCDELVPYGTAPHHYCKTNAPGWLMLFGSYSIYRHVVDFGGGCSLITFCGGGHEYSGELFDANQILVVDFLKHVLAGDKIQDHTIINTGKSCDRSKEYGFCD
ncbi:MAG: alpha/beta hydrolase [Bacteroidales bacterium]